MADVSVIITHRVHGFHYWNAAPDEVSYLRHRHRHLFFIVVAWPVNHTDRDIEFHIAQGWVKEATGEGPRDFGSKSCEMIAQDIYKNITDAGRPCPRWIEVWEDNEVGARVEF